jgi:hypothetical protein
MDGVEEARLKTRFWVNLCVGAIYPLGATALVLLDHRTWLMFGAAVFILAGYYHFRRAISAVAQLGDLRREADGAGPNGRSENREAPKKWLLRCALYGLTAFYALPVIMFGTGAAVLFADRAWVGASMCAAVCIVYAVVGWKRLHGKLTYTKPPLILELRRGLDR